MGNFIVSLDFELFWGVRDQTSLEAYRDRLLKTRKAIPEMLRRFEASQVHATWATVGFLFADGRNDLLDHRPDVLPEYTDQDLSPYGSLGSLGQSEKDDPFHFAPSLLQKIADAPHQEIATHTFSHYYCLESGQTERAFEADLRAARSIGARFGEVTKSLVFPRGQENTKYAGAMRRSGVRAYRTAPSFAAYRPSRIGGDGLLKRAARLADAYVPISGHNAHPTTRGTDPLPMAASSFLRPHSPKLARLETLRLLRIERSMKHAAKNDSDFHLWWHPHNFGAYANENFRMLDAVLRQYVSLRDSYGWQSQTMGEVAEARFIAS